MHQGQGDAIRGQRPLSGASVRAQHDPGPGLHVCSGRARLTLGKSSCQACAPQRISACDAGPAASERQDCRRGALGRKEEAKGMGDEHAASNSGQAGRPLGALQPRMAVPLWQSGRTLGVCCQACASMQRVQAISSHANKDYAEAYMRMMAACRTKGHDPKCHRFQPSESAEVTLFQFSEQLGLSLRK